MSKRIRPYVPDDKDIPKDRCIPKDKCIIRGVYILSSRNLVCGVWDGNGFVGNREKFGHWRIDKEYHWDDGEPFGTAKPIKLITTVPDDISLVSAIITQNKKGDSANVTNSKLRYFLENAYNEHHGLNI